MALGGGDRTRGSQKALRQYRTAGQDGARGHTQNGGGMSSRPRPECAPHVRSQALVGLHHGSHVDREMTERRRWLDARFIRFALQRSAAVADFNEPSQADARLRLALARKAEAPSRAFDDPGDDGRLRLKLSACRPTGTAARQGGISAFRLPSISFFKKMTQQRGVQP